jgi:OmpA-OmpF porin, OOP family
VSRSRNFFLAGALLLGGTLAISVPDASAQTTVPAAATPATRGALPDARSTVQPGAIVVSGTVPDEATRQAIVARVRELYGADRVVDQVGIGNLVAPPNWSAQVQKLISSDLKQISRGQVSVQGNVIELRGEVSNEAQRQQIVSQMLSSLNNATYTVRNGLRVTAAGQERLDAALANRIIEFEPGSAELTERGQQVLDQLVPVLRELPGRRFEIIGHTDAVGSRSTNVALSVARAESVRTYLARKGMNETLFSASGVGPDRPLASNDNADGRARNRRIEFRAVQQ